MKDWQVLKLAMIVVLLLALFPAASPTTPARADSGAVRWGWYITYDPTSLASLQANIGSLNVVAPWYYRLDGNGNLSGAAQANVDTLLRNNHVRIYAMVKNSVVNQDFHNWLADPTKRDHGITNLYNMVINNGYDGINIDFETLLASDATLYTDFAHRLSNKLHASGKVMTMAVAPKTSDGGNSFSGVYDYAGLAPYLDYVTIMAYDFHYVTGTAGPIGPVDSISRVAAYTATRFPASKVIWGIGLYGFDWNTTLGGRANPLHFGDVAPLQQQYGGESGFDDASQSPWLIYYDANGNRHEVWYENAASFTAKLNAISQYNFAGFALWRLGHEDPAIWPLVAAGGGSNLCAPIPAFGNTRDRVYFAPTGHSLSGRFLQYWGEHGGLAIFGYPLTEPHLEVSPTDGRTYTVQYFERNRFEYHPENAPPYDVLLGLLGVKARQGQVAPPHDPVPDTESQHYFAETQHLLQGGFLNYWRGFGGLAQFGYPLTDEFAEVNPSDGRTYTVQYFERARFEYHPEYAGTFNEVLLGLLGVDSVRELGCQ